VVGCGGAFTPAIFRCSIDHLANQTAVGLCAHLHRLINGDGNHLDRGVPSQAGGWIAGYRSGKELAGLAALTALLTIIVTLSVTHFTGVATGLLEPLINRPIAGFLAATLFNVLRKAPPSGDD
jgi:hypothetical protein